MLRILLLLILIIVGCESDNDSSFLNVQSDIDTTIASIGDVINLSFNANNTRDRSIIFPDIQETESMEIRKKTILKKQNTPYQVNFEIVFWDTGSFTIPEYPVEILTADSTKEIIITADSINIKIISMLTGANDTNLRPIKDPIALRRPINWYRLILAIALVALLLLLFSLWRKRIHKKPLEKINVSKYQSAKDIASERLKELEKILNVNNKIFYTQLSFTMREFLENQFYIRALEMTTPEIKEFESDYKLSKNDFDNIIKLLDRADLAKFAKIEFSVQHREADYEWMRSFISNIAE